MKSGYSRTLCSITHYQLITWFVSCNSMFLYMHNRYRLTTEYGTSVGFTDLWDRLQSEGRCCGIYGPQDFILSTNRTYPLSCCSMDSVRQVSLLRRPMTSAVMLRNDDTADLKLNLTEQTDSTWNHITSDGIRMSSICHAIHQQGCFDELSTWLRNTADILFVLGYCVIAFLKITFLGILRYEIKEMIQKIKLLQQEMNGEWQEGGDGEQHQNYQSVMIFEFSCVFILVYDVVASFHNCTCVAKSIIGLCSTSNTKHIC